jgi:hypothetical protein
MNLLGDKILLVYSGSPDAHVAGHKWDIGIATIRADGFAALAADGAGGELLTKPLTFPAGELTVNANVQPGGYIRAELLDADGRVLPGYSLQDCQEVRGDSTAAALRWNENKTLEAAPSSGSRIRFRLQNARLYSFWIQP